MLIFLSACSGPEPVAPPPAPQDLPSLGLETPGGSLLWRGLDHLDTATVSLPPAATAAPTPERFPLTGAWTDRDRKVGRLRFFSHPLPYFNDMPRPNYSPWGARMMRGTTEIPYVNDPGDIRAAGWFVEGDQAVILAIEDPARWKDPPTIVAPELAAEEKRRRWDGTTPALEFVRAEVTVGRHTRPGVQLPPGGSVTFSLTLPRDGRLDFGVLERAPVLVGTEQGAATVRWSLDGKELGDASSAPGALPSEQHSEIAAGSHQLTFSADASNQANVVVTAPTISARADAPRHVVVVGIDTLRQDSLGTYGYSRPTSPELDAWAGQSVVFDAAWAPAPRTRPSFRTAFTGRYPLAAATAPTLAEALSTRGFRTAGVVANVHLVPRFGFNDGFEEWIYENGAKADVQVDRALAWQEAHQDEDTFLFLHLMDPHTLYNAPEPYGSRFTTGSRPEKLPPEWDRWHVYQILHEPFFDQRYKDWIRGAYDGEVAWTSHQLSRFLGRLENVRGRTLTVVHSDHGEEMFDHGLYEHNHSLYDELVRVALWIRPPGGVSPRRIAAPVGLIDLVPTVLDLLDEPTLPSDGRSLAAFVDPADAGARSALEAELLNRPLALGHLMFAEERWGVVDRGWKYILQTASGVEELYDLAADPHEQDNRIATAPAERLSAARAALAQSTGWPVRPGWRLEWHGPRRPFEVRFSVPVAAAGVIDPEAERDTRANLEWGEVPPVTVADVGTVTMSEDRLVVRIVPGPKADDHRFWIGCDGACPSGEVATIDATLPLAEGDLLLPGGRVEAHLGTVIEVPPTDEHLRGPAEANQLQALEALGYLAPD